MKASLAILLAALLLLAGCGTAARNRATPTPTASPTPAPTPTPSPSEAAAGAKTVEGSFSGGAFTSDRFTVRLPSGYREQEFSGLAAFVPPLFPLDIGVVTILQSPYSDRFESFGQEDYQAYLQAAYTDMGLDTEVRVVSFDPIQLGGADGYRGEVQAEVYGFTMRQLLYSVKDGGTVYTLAYSQIGSDKDAEFEASAATLAFLEP